MPKMTRPDGRTVSVSEAGVEALRARGYTDASDTPAPPPAAAAPVDERPAKSAPKPDWVAYAESQGLEPADNYTKAELVDRFGG